jgi:flagellar biosynthesis/type III secretory pathway protein FliH
MSSLKEMWEAQMREQWEAQQRERVFCEGKREGEREGEREAKRKTLVKLLTLKFGSVSEPDLLTIEQVDAVMLETCLERVLTADSIAAVLAPE